MNKNQLYFEFVYEEYMEKYSENTYLLELISFCDWKIIPDEKNPGVGADGYSPRAMYKSLLIKVAKKIKTINDLIYFLKTNPKLSHEIGFDPIKKGIPTESTYSRFRKSCDIELLYSLISESIFKGIEKGIFDESTLCIDSYPVVFDSFFNNRKRHGKPISFSKYYKSTIEADFGHKAISNDKPLYDKNGKEKKSMVYVGYKAHTVSFLNVPIFTAVTPASSHDSPLFQTLLKRVMGMVEITGFDVLADKAYDSIGNYDFVHDMAGGRAFIPLRSSSKKSFHGECGKKLSIHSHYFEKNRGYFRFKYFCNDSSDCPLNKKSCYRYCSHSRDDYRHFFERSSKKFKTVYSKRTLIESIFSRIESDFSSTSLRFINSVNLEANLFNLFLICSAHLAHYIGRDDLLASPKSLKYAFASR